MVPLLPQPTAATRDEDPPYEVKETAYKGFGMFANRFIPKGSHILTEHPAYIIPGFASDKVSFEDYEHVGRLIPQPLFAEVEKMANCRSKEECPSLIEGVARTNALTLGLQFPPDFDEIDPRPTARHYGGLFLKIGRCNHSCGPNAAWKWDFASLSSTLFALRDIKPGEEICHTYVHPLQSRAKRWKKLKPDYRFECDCPWCTLPTPEAQEESDKNREYVGMYLQTRPSYAKWSTDLCLPDTFVIDSHLAVSTVIRKEGLDRLIPLFLEEIVRCLAELGDEHEFRRWAGETIKLCRVGNRPLAEELEMILQNPEKNCPKWGRRKRMREEPRRKSEEQYDFDSDDSFSLDLLQVPE